MTLHRSLYESIWLISRQDFTDLKVKDVPVPRPKDHNDVVVKITHAAVTHVDMLYAQGLHLNVDRLRKALTCMNQENIRTIAGT
jgi:NADPH:quinone reductase-like Zn-dependent oxidoreductase